VKQIPLTKGYTAIVDDEDYDRLVSMGRWQASVTRDRVYAIHSLNRGRIYMHRALVPGAPLIDHVDGNGLDNRRANLRVATRAQNSMNMRLMTGTRTGFKGVARQPRSNANPWRAYIRVDGRSHWLGVFPTREAAARAYDDAALSMFGEFARLNFPQGATA
jgi:hypothetical protein